MKVEALLFGAGIVFFSLLAVLYWVFSGEPVGTTALTLTAGLALLISFYLWYTGRRLGPRPEDRADAEIPEGAGDLGFFSPSSWWPLPLAASGALVFLGVVFGLWLTAAGVVAALIALVGWLFEYYRGDHAH